MSEFNIKKYLASLPFDIEYINIKHKDITYLPDLTRFTKLKILICPHNQLSTLPSLPENLIELCCCNNQLTYLPILPKTLEKLICSDNQLTNLPSLPKNIQLIYCSNNKLTYLPTLPENLKQLFCYNNKLSCLPILPENLSGIVYIYNPIYEVINSSNIIITKQKVKILNNCRYLYYCLKLKEQFRNWLWVKIREPKIKAHYHPDNLTKQLTINKDIDIDLDTVLDSW
jgi:hypothetical protein